MVYLFWTGTQYDSGGFVPRASDKWEETKRTSWPYSSTSSCWCYFRDYCWISLLTRIGAVSGSGLSFHITTQKRNLWDCPVLYCSLLDRSVGYKKQKRTLLIVFLDENPWPFVAVLLILLVLGWTFLYNFRNQLVWVMNGLCHEVSSVLFPFFVPINININMP